MKEGIIMQYESISEGINKDSFMDNIFGIGSHYSHHEDKNESNVLDRLLTDEISASRLNNPPKMVHRST